jgi:DNA processing protein
MAEGIDTQAHLGCLEAGGRTIAVLGTGVDVPYPQRNQGLHHRLEEQGLIVSEYPAGTQPNRVHFPRRNRIIAGMSRATLVIEAPSKSGALITAYLANDYGRDVYVLPHSLDNVRATGCLGLVHRGAQMVLGIGHLLEMLGKMPAVVTSPDIAQNTAQNTAKRTSKPHPERSAPIHQSAPSLTPDQQSLAETLQQLVCSSGQSTISFDLLVEHTQQPPGDLSSTLLQLELLGVVVQHPGMRYAPS